MTTGSNRRFLKLVETKVYVDLPEYDLHPAGKLLGILQSIAA